MVDGQAIDKLLKTFPDALQKLPRPPFTYRLKLCSSILHFDFTCSKTSGKQSRTPIHTNSQTLRNVQRRHLFRLENKTLPCWIRICTEAEKLSGHDGWANFFLPNTGSPNCPNKLFASSRLTAHSIVQGSDGQQHFETLGNFVCISNIVPFLCANGTSRSSPMFRCCIHPV